MTTNIRTSSKNHFNKYQNYLNNKRVLFTTSFKNEVYTLNLFGLTTTETNTLISKMIKHFHLVPKQQEPLALAA